MKNKNVHRLHDNIYITSNEKPKEGDWYLDKYNNIYYLVTKVESNGDGKKIILATERDLIKDGVQAIDDEFLEWFVNNPSCEEVEVADIWKEGNPSTHYSYQLIIPQEEPKQRLDCPYDFTSRCTMGNCDCKPKLDTVGKQFYETADKVITVKRQETLNLDKLESKLDDALAKETKESLTDWLNSKRNKQETLEEACETELYENINIIIDGGKDLPKGITVSRGQAVDYAFNVALKSAKWQAERMYEIMNAYADDVMGGCNLRAEEWFEKFKSK
jgi:hypothetical protein